MREINKLIIHCSDSSFGDTELVRRWHTQPKMPDDVAFKIKNKLLPRSTAKNYGNAWSDIGYHYVILNGYRKGGEYRPEDDGLIELGRPLERAGAHCRGHNKNSVAACLIGRRLFSGKQLYEAIPKIIKRIGAVKDIEIYGHYELDSHKTCPNVDMDLIRQFLKNRRI